MGGPGGEAVLWRGEEGGQVIRPSWRIPRIDGFALRMAMFYAAYFTFGGIQMPYLPAWLAAKALDDGEIGVVLAVPMIVRVAVLPLAARLVDRRFDPRYALAVTAAASAV